MTIRFTPFLVLLGLFAVTMAHPLPARAGMSIEALVNGVAITSFDVAQRAKLLQLTGRMAAGRAQKAALEELIEEKLQLEAMKRQGVSVSDRQVDEAFGSIAQRVKLTPANLAAALRNSGVQPSTLKSRLRAQIGWSQIVNAGAEQSTTSTEQEVIAALKADKSKQSGEASEAYEFDVTQITFVVPKSAGKSKEQARKQEIANLAKRFTSCEEGLDIARKLPDVVVQPLGTRLASELSGPFLPLVQKTAVGRITEALRTGNGYEAVAVCGKREVSSSVAEIQNMSRVLRGKEAKMTARRYMRDLRRDAMIEYK